MPVSEFLFDVAWLSVKNITFFDDERTIKAFSTAIHSASRDVWDLSIFPEWSFPFPK